MNPHLRGQRAIEGLAAKQFGAFARAQALERGVTRRVIDGRVADGAWPLVLPGVHRVAVVGRSLRQSAMAAALWSAPDGLVLHQSAARLWGFGGIAAERVHLTVPGERSLRSKKVAVHHTGDLLPADVGRRGPIAVTSALRTAIDLAAIVDADALEIAIESGLRRRLFSVGQLRWRADALMGAGRPGTKALRELLTSRELGKADSAWEVRTAQLLERAGLGAPTRQHPIEDNGKVIARADLAYPEAKVVVEYDSDEWHSGTSRRHHDAERRNQLRSLGWTVLEVTPAQLRAPTNLLAAVALVLAA